MKKINIAENKIVNNFLSRNFFILKKSLLIKISKKLLLIKSEINCKNQLIFL